jgi:hypothetical protein
MATPELGSLEERLYTPDCVARARCEVSWDAKMSESSEDSDMGPNHIDNQKDSAKKLKKKTDEDEVNSH